MMKSKIQEYIKLHPKSWGALIQRDSIIMEVLSPIIEEFDISVQAAAYCFVTGTSPACKNGNQKVFTWYAKGFAYCGKRGVCKCHTEEAVTKGQATNLQKYGNPCYTKTDDYKGKTKETNLAKFGVEHASFNADIRDKAKRTCFEKYGTAYPIQLSEFKDKLRETKRQKHNDSTFNNVEKRLATMLEKYNVTNANYIHMNPATVDLLKNCNKFKEFITGKSKQLVTEELRIDSTTLAKYTSIYNCSELYSLTGSKYEEQLNELLNSLGVKYERNNRSIIAPFELDFYLPEFNVAIEVNGNYWHCEDKRGKFYHYDKWVWCNEKGVALLQYFEDDFSEHWPIIESKIRYICKKHTTRIGARSVTIKPVPFKEESKFLNLNHIQGESRARNGSFAAYYNENIVGLISWIQRKNYLEITRFSTDINICCPGLFSKLLKHVISNLNFVGTIVSFSNNSHSNGNLYKAAGFTNVQILGPAYWYMLGYRVRENRQKYMKGKIKHKFGIDITGKTEFELMDSLGYKRIWDSGKIKWALEVK